MKIPSNKLRQRIVALCRRALCSALFGVVLSTLPLLAARAAPEATQGEIKQEARQRFDAGLAAYDAADFEGALAEFERAYQLTQHPLVLYNIGLVHAGRNDPAASVATLEKLLRRDDHGLDPNKLATARATLEAQSAKLGLLRVEVNVAGARLQVNGIDVSEQPGDQIRVRAGVHLIGVMAPGYAPSQQRVAVASGSLSVLAVSLEPLDEALAQLLIRSNVSDASVFVNGTEMGLTPLASSLGVRPGRYHVRLQRAGYRAAQRVVDLQSGSSGELEVELEIDTAAMPAAFGRLKLSVSEANAVVQLDGEPLIIPAAGTRLPLGRHQLVIQRDGFYDVARDVIVSADTALQVELLPRPHYLRDYVESARSTRRWAWLATGAGALATLGGAGFLVYNHGEKDAAKRAFDEQAATAASEPSRACGDDTCQRLLEIRLDELERVRARDPWGYAALGVGAALLGTGMYLFATGDDPERYAPTKQSDVFGGMRVDVGFGTLGVVGAF